MNRALCLLLLSTRLHANDWYVSSTGTGNGTFGSPGSLSDAITGGGGWGPAIGGDTVWLRGGAATAGYLGGITITNGPSSGNRVKPWNVSVTGISSASMLTFRSYPGEMATIGGSWDFSQTAKFLRFRDMAFTNPNRGHDQTNSASPTGPWSQFSVSSQYSGNEMINCILYNVNNITEKGGFIIFKGCIIWNEGVNGLEHAWYSAATNISGNVVLWGQDNTLNFTPDNQPVALIASNIWVSGATQAAINGATNNVLHIGNFHYKTTSNVSSTVIGVLVDGIRTNRVIWNTIIMTAPLSFGASIIGGYNEVLSNTICGMNTNVVGGPTFVSSRAVTTGDWLFNRNNYYSRPGGLGVRFSEPAGTRTPAQWKGLGFDADSTFTDNTFPPAQTYVIVNQDQTNRANVAVWNPDHNPTAIINLSGVLSSNQTYHVWSLQGMEYGEIQSGTFNGVNITVPMTNLPVATVNGQNWNVIQPGQLGPEFAAFMVMATNPIAPHVVLSGQATVSGNVIIQ